MVTIKTEILEPRPFAMITALDVDMIDTQQSRTAATSGLELLGRGAKELVQAVQKLRNLGIEDLGLPLPKIAVIGDQSTGKSSLIEGISEIKVPRNAGTCTRCPLEINLTETSIVGDGWRCKVSLFKKYTYGGAWSSPSYEGVTDERPLGPWVPQEPENFPFALIKNKDHVGPILRLAQLATLNPSQPYEKYLPGVVNPGTGIQVQFSPNIVRLDISGPGLPNMSFYDLPGVISVHGMVEDQYLVDLVKNLVIGYIQDENCINILTLPMTDDPSNSSASVLIRRANAGARTVGVLSKPDRIQHGESLSQWVQILSDERFRLGFGYFVIKNNPDSTVDHAIARAEEEAFFRCSPWSTTLAQHRTRFGTLELQKFLSDRLTIQIKASLPHIVEQVQRKTAAIDAELAVLPESPIGNLPMAILERLLEFEADIKLRVGGSFKTDWHKMALMFRRVLEESRPEIVTSSEINGNMNYHPETPTKRQKYQISTNGADNPETPSKRQKHQHQATIVLDSDSDEPNPSPRVTNDRQKNVSRNLFSDRVCGKRFTVAEINDIIQNGFIALPHQTDPKVVERMIKLSLKHWEKPLDQFLDGTEKLFQQLFEEHIARSFGQWRSTKLHAQVVEICSVFLKDTMACERQVAKRALQLEVHTPTALDSDGLQLATEKAREEIQADRRAHLVGLLLKRQNMHVVSPLAKTSKITDEKLGPDPNSSEYELLATVRGYYEYALSRFVDVISLGLRGGIFLKCRDELGPLIKEKLVVKDLSNGDQHCAALLEVDDATRERKIQLSKDRAVMREAQEWLESLTIGARS